VALRNEKPILNRAGRRLFQLDKWKEENGTNLLCSPGFFEEDRSICFQDAYGILDKLAKANGHYYPHQICAAIEIANEILEKGDIVSIGAIVNALMQSGKTGVMKALLDLSEYMFGPRMKNWPYTFIVISCPSSWALVQQTISRLRGCPIGRASMRQLTLNTELVLQELTDFIENDGTLEDFETELFERWLGSDEGWQKNPYIPNRSVVIFDEADFGNAENGVLDKFLALNGIYLNQEPSTWLKKDIKLIFLSATNISATIATENQKHFKTINIDAPDEYRGPHEMKYEGKVHSSWGLSDAQGRKRLAKETDRIVHVGEQKYILIRASTRNNNSRVLKKFFEDRYGAMAEVICLNADTKGKVGDLCQVPGSRRYNPQKGMFSQKPKKPTIVILKNMLSRGVSVWNEHIGLCFERIRSASESASDFIVQSLVGRMCGYKEHFPHIYTHTSALNDYIEWVDDDYSATACPKVAARVKTTRNQLWGVAAHVEMEGSKNTRDHFKSGSKLAATRSSIVRYMLEESGNQSVLDRMDSKKQGNFYLHQWSQDNGRAEAYRKHLEDSKYSTMRGMSYMFQQADYLIFYDAPKGSSTVSITVVFKEDYQPEYVTTSVKTAHGMAA